MSEPTPPPDTLPPVPEAEKIRALLDGWEDRLKEVAHECRNHASNLSLRFLRERLRAEALLQALQQLLPYGRTWMPPHPEKCGAACPLCELAAAWGRALAAAEETHARWAPTPR